MAQKARKEAERKRVVEEEEKKKRTLEYLQQLWNKVLAEGAAFLEGAERFQIVGSKHKEVSPEDNRNCQPSKKTKGKQPARYHRDNRVKMGNANPYERCVHARQDWLVHNSR